MASHGTFKDVIQFAAAHTGYGSFDVLFLLPIHPISKANRKGKNNSVTSQPGAPGSPWAIGESDEGDTKLYCPSSVRWMITRTPRQARERGIDIALDLAFQCAPDHPYVQEHPGMVSPTA